MVVDSPTDRGADQPLTSRRQPLDLWPIEPGKQVDMEMGAHGRAHHFRAEHIGAIRSDNDGIDAAGDGGPQDRSDIAGVLNGVKHQDQTTGGHRFRWLRNADHANDALGVLGIGDTAQDAIGDRHRNLAKGIDQLSRPAVVSNGVRVIEDERNLGAGAERFFNKTNAFDKERAEFIAAPLVVETSNGTDALVLEARDRFPLRATRSRGRRVHSVSSTLLGFGHGAVSNRRTSVDRCRLVGWGALARRQGGVRRQNGQRLGLG